MSNQIEKTKTFEEKMMDRVKESIGDLMSDEDLAKIVEKGVNETFFQEKVERDQWGHEKNRKPALINQILKEILEKKVELAVDKYAIDHQDEISEALERIISEGAGMAFIKAINNKFSQDLSNFAFNIQQSIERSLHN